MPYGDTTAVGWLRMRGPGEDRPRGAHPQCASFAAAGIAANSTPVVTFRTLMRNILCRFPRPAQARPNSPCGSSCVPGGCSTPTMRPHFARFGVTGAQWGRPARAPSRRGRGPAALRLTDIGRALLVQPPSVTSVVDRLERLALVARRAAASDHRAKEVVLTPKGRRLVCAGAQTPSCADADGARRPDRRGSAQLPRAHDARCRPHGQHLPSLRPEGASRHE